MGVQSKVKVTDWEKVAKRLARVKNPTVEFINVELTPDEAKKILQGNESNRHLNIYLINKYLRLMNMGRWVLNGETIKLGQEKGEVLLLDGQHRLNAIMKADKPILVSLALGLNPKYFTTIDTGRSRSAGDVLKIAGYKNVHTLSAAIRWLLTYERDANFNWVADICPDDVLEGIKRWPKMQDFITHAERLRFVMQPSIGVFFVYLTRHIDPEKSFDFFNKIEHGKDLDKKSPLLAFRTIMIKYRSQQLLFDKRYAMAYLINTWNAYYCDVQVSSIRWKPGQPFPEIEGVNRKALFKKNSL